MSVNTGRFRLHTADGVELKAGLIVWVIDQSNKAYRGSVHVWDAGNCTVQVIVVDLSPKLPPSIARFGDRAACWAGYLYAKKPASPVGRKDYEPGGPTGRRGNPHRRVHPRKVAS